MEALEIAQLDGAAIEFLNLYQLFVSRVPMLDYFGIGVGMQPVWHRIRSIGVNPCVASFADGSRLTGNQGSTMKNIAVGIDFTLAKEPILKCASELAHALCATLHVAHIVSPEPAFVGYPAYTYPGPEERRDELQDEMLEIQTIIDHLIADGIDARGYMPCAPTVEGLTDFATDRKAEMIIVGSHSRSTLAKILIGSTASGLLRHSKIPTLIIPIRKHSEP